MKEQSLSLARYLLTYKHDCSFDLLAWYRTGRALLVEYCATQSRTRRQGPGGFSGRLLDLALNGTKKV